MIAIYHFDNFFVVISHSYDRIRVKMQESLRMIIGMNLAM